MAERTTSSITINAEPAVIMDVIAGFADYPVWAKGVKVAEVRESFPDGRARQVYFQIDVSPIKDDYTLEYSWHDEQQVTWSLVEGRMLTALDGSYVLAPLSTGATEVTYTLALDLAIPLIGMLKRKGEKILIDTALKGLKTRVESL